MSKPMDEYERRAWRDGFACAMRIAHAGAVLNGHDAFAKRMAVLPPPRASWTGAKWPLRKNRKQAPR